VDQGLGFIFGVVRGILLVAIAFFLYNTVMTTQSVEMVNNSRSAAVFAKMTDGIAEQNPEQALGWLTQQYEGLVGACGTK
jgi:membrane protein required for colicin V production